jgi:hypothetical protein
MSKPTFIQTYPQGLKDFDLTMSHFKTLYLISYLSGQTSYFNNQIDTINYQLIAEKLGLSLGHVKNLITDLRKKGWIITSGKVEVVSPKIFFKGTGDRRAATMKKLGLVKEKKTVEKKIQPQKSISWYSLAEAQNY